ncbi:VOC family protein [Arenimonas oryziterrae]|uniref:VOC domain-containing protein n=1 Tax=Arenimonas oryziterrae DSM 21050 = YC6267 TaxID=1121015 RepID=A0A091B9S0_9GAMM|nr:VOC family protein [Arenimonas oryziterrae]KFN41210.1 hypothetical protein N789_04805 [Arenimonas oryziterrae DSM 21050 = YC6267]
MSTLVNKATSVLFVEHIVPSLALWENKLGFKRVAEVPEGDELGFVLLVRDGVEIMLQSRASLAADLPAVAAQHRDSASFVFIEVPDLDAILARLGDSEVVNPVRDTFYGSREITIREPGGHFVTFAHFTPPPG